jgi:hypothetical protein
MPGNAPRLKRASSRARLDLIRTLVLLLAVGPLRLG